MSAIRPAATVVLLREHANQLEVLLLRRNKAVQFASGLWVFPGGAIDAEDFGDDPRNLMRAAKRAAIREAHEEAGINIADCELQFFAHWTTPEHEIKRYATWFFVVTLPDSEKNIVVDGGEIVEHRWLDPRWALDLHRAGDLEMMPPTFITLTELATCNSIREVEAMYRDRPIVEILPKFVAAGLALYPGDAGYESENAAAIVSRHRCYRRNDGWHYECDLPSK